MKISGERMLDYPVEMVYAVASDIEGLASQFSQVSSVEKLDAQTSRINIELDFGVYSGTYYADLVLIDAIPPYEFSIKGKHKSKLGGMTLNCTTSLVADDSNRTFVRMEGDFNRTGMLRLANRKVVKKGVEFGVQLMLKTIEEKIKHYSNRA